jgi:hypothetical protein
VLKLQAEVAQTIASQIHQLVVPEHTDAGGARQVHPQAYEAYLKGIFFRDKLTPVDLEKSIGLFTQAIDLDPAYAQAYGALSQSYFYLGIFGVGHPREVFPKARSNAVKALELDEPWRRLTTRWRSLTSFMTGIGQARKRSLSGPWN